MTSPTYIIMPILGARDYTITAVADCLAQSVPARLLLINQGVEDPFREELEQIAEEHGDRILLWSHQPPLPSLAATWNRALRFVWEAGGSEALVVNNDVRLHRQTVESLQRVRHASEALFVSAVGVTAEQFTAVASDGELWQAISGDLLNNVGIVPTIGRGGPDFSCFLISRECHDRYSFDEAFVPAYCEDLDYHRRLLLAGEGRRIFSVNLPYLHYAAGTLKTATPEARQAIERQIGAGSRAHYQKKWGGPVNQETFLAPFGVPHATLGTMFEGPDAADARTDGTATTPYLQAHPPVDPSEEAPDVP